MRIFPHMSKGIVFVHEDGKSYELAPLQVFALADGRTCIRIGRNCLFFNRDGAFDGSESKTARDAPMQELMEAFNIAGEMNGQAPSTSYFQEGSPGHESETKAWPFAKKPPQDEAYLVTHSKPPTPRDGSN